MACESSSRMCMIEVDWHVLLISFALALTLPAYCAEQTTLMCTGI